MTDAEKELKDLAQRAEDKRCGGYWPDDLRRLHGALWPKDVLALLERIEKLEDACIAAHKELFLGGGGPESVAQAEKILAETVP